MPDPLTLPPPSPDGEATDLTSSDVRRLIATTVLQVADDLREARAEQRAMAAALARLEAAQAQPGQLAAILQQPVWPGRVEVRLSTVLLLGGGLVAAFGADRVAGWLPSWASGVVGVAP